MDLWIPAASAEQCRAGSEDVSRRQPDFFLLPVRLTHNVTQRRIATADAAATCKDAGATSSDRGQAVPGRGQASASIPAATMASASPTHWLGAIRSRSTIAASRIVPAGYIAVRTAAMLNPPSRSV